VNTLRAVVVLTVLAAVGCEKTNDLPRMHDEVLATRTAYQQRFDELARRAEALRQRTAALPPDALRDATGVFRHATGTIEEYRRNLQQVPTMAEAGVKSGDPGQLEKLIDSMRERFEHGMTEVTAELSAVESAIALAEQRQTAPRVPPPSAEPATTDDSQGSAAPIR
jgi:hypothetical protein